MLLFVYLWYDLHNKINIHDLHHASYEQDLIGVLLRICTVWMFFTLACCLLFVFVYFFADPLAITYMLHLCFCVCLCVCVSAFCAIATDLVFIGLPEETQHIINLTALQRLDYRQPCSILYGQDVSMTTQFPSSFHRSWNRYYWTVAQDTVTHSIST